MKLIFDQMLGNLASWCRILGIDSESFSGNSDSEFIQDAKRQNRTIMTRDARLAERCGRDGIGCVFVREGTLEEQLAQILKDTGAAVTFPEKTRCASCNGELEDVPRESVEDDVEADTYAHTGRFWRCSKCGKVFWEGGHWKNIRGIYGKAKSLAAGQHKDI